MITVALLIFASILLCSCADRTHLQINYDAKTYFDISVPENSKISFQLVWYRLSTLDYAENNQIDGLFTVGKDIELYGQNTDQLNGAAVSISQNELNDLIDESYYKNILMEEDYIYETGKYGDRGGKFASPNESEINQAKKLLKPYIEKAKVLNFNLTFTGIISEEINIEKIEVKSISYMNSFDTFIIRPLDLPEDNTSRIFSVFEPTSIGGILIGPSLSNCGYYFLEGTAQSVIKEIKSVSLNDICQMINMDNYKEYERLCEAKFDTEQKKTNFSAEDKISIEFDYAFDNFDNSRFKTYDVAVASIAAIFDSYNDENLYSYLYQTTMRAPEYGLVHILHSLREK